MICYSVTILCLSPLSLSPCVNYFNLFIFDVQDDVALSIRLRGLRRSRRPDIDAYEETLVSLRPKNSCTDSQSDMKTKSRIEVNDETLKIQEIQNMSPVED